MSQISQVHLLGRGYAYTSNTELTRRNRRTDAMVHVVGVRASNASGVLRQSMAR